ncbi:cysteine-rich CWC family protein [Burkholderia sp.]|uniref:cysteine-rich CWC family protein n=1 Tax=Burkholderia sp. TaxID=36773 RepID=UPI0025BBE570|nr:cysteine-rich CWC family protein [Burkholderia sp.]MBS6359134.1 cysteine-rich CWC family protein [Burkholderia sp.]
MTESTDDRRPDPGRARCPRCGRSFDCGAHTRPFDCWCASMPAMPPGAQPARGARCLCPECLADDIVRHVAADREKDGQSGAHG